MSYRKIQVDGATYEYVVGRSHVKVKGVGVVPKHEVGQRHRNPYAHNLCCWLTTHVMVTPGDLAAWIRRCTHK